MIPIRWREMKAVLPPFWLLSIEKEQLGVKQ